MKDARKDSKCQVKFTVKEFLRKDHERIQQGTVTRDNTRTKDSYRL